MKADKFIKQYNRTIDQVLSLGWTTGWQEDPEKGYTEKQINAMTKILNENVQPNTNEGLNFPVRALYAIKDQTILKNFIENVRKTHPEATYSVWSGEDDKFDAGEVTKFVNLIGIDKVYLSLTDELRKQINLGNAASRLIQFGLLNLATLVIVTIFRNGLH